MPCGMGLAGGAGAVLAKTWRLPDDVRSLAMNYYRGSEVGKKTIARARRLERVIALGWAMNKVARRGRAGVE